MNHSFENVRKHMQEHRKPSVPTVRRVGTAAALLAVFAVTCMFRFTSLCADLVSTSDADISSAALSLDDIASTDVQSFAISVEYDGKTYNCQVCDGWTAGEAVYALGLNVGSAFVLDPPAQTELSEGDTIRVLPCTVKERTVIEEIPFETTFVQSSAVERGSTRTVTDGQPGEQKVLYRDRYVNGECVSSERIAATVTKEPINAICTVGTKKTTSGSDIPISKLAPADFRLDENGAPAQYKSYFDGTATAYYGGGLTSTGVPAAVGYVAVNPNVIPYGTKLYITSLDGEIVYGYAIAADTGGFAKGGWADVDLYMNTYEECVRFGKRGVRIYIL